MKEDIREVLDEAIRDTSIYMLKGFAMNRITSILMIVTAMLFQACSEQKTTPVIPKGEQELFAEIKRPERDAEFERLSERLSQFLGKRVVEIEKQVEIIRSAERYPIEEPWNCLRGVGYFSNNVSIGCYYDSNDPLFRSNDWKQKDLGQGVISGIQIRKGALHCDLGTNIPFQFQFR